MSSAGGESAQGAGLASRDSKGAQGALAPTMCVPATLQLVELQLGKYLNSHPVSTMFGYGLHARQRGGVKVQVRIDDKTSCMLALYVAEIFLFYGTSRFSMILYGANRLTSSAARSAGRPMRDEYIIGQDLCSAAKRYQPILNVAFR